MKEKIALTSVGVNASLSLLKIIIGALSGSTAVLADGVHSIMDVVSSIISLVGIKISEKPADKKHPYGHYKFEVLSGLFITIILFLTGLAIMYEAYKSFSNPQLLKFQRVSLIIMAISALSNEVMARLKIHFGKKENSTSLLSDGIHSRVDVYTSIAVFVGLILDKYWIYSDCTIAFIIGVYIIKESINLGKESTDSLLDASADIKTEDKIREICKDQKVQLVDLRTQKKGAVITANLIISLPNDISIKDAAGISESLKENLVSKINNLEYVSIQIRGEDSTLTYFRPKGFGMNDLKWEECRFKNEQEKDLYCVCPNCNYKVKHKRGVPCSNLNCPECGTKMTREN